jgi:valyl-tRNA synthetase
MAWVLDQCMILLHPIMPFITEELWATTGTRAKPLVHADWPTYGSELIDEDALREMNWVTKLIDDIRSARAQMHVPAGLKVTLLRIGLDETATGAYDRNAALIARLARIETVSDATEMPKGAITLAAEGGMFAIPLAGLIDIDEEKARLAKTLEKLAKDLGGLKGRLNNPNFVENAKPEVVVETREKLAMGEEEAQKIKAALARLAEIG